MIDEHCPATTHGTDFPRRGADSDRSKEKGMTDERCPAATCGTDFLRRARIPINRRR